MSYLRYLCLLSYSDTYCVVFLLCCTSSCVTYVVGFSGLFILIDPSAFFFVYLTDKNPESQ